MQRLLFAAPALGLFTAVTLGTAQAATADAETVRDYATRHDPTQAEPTQAEPHYEWQYHYGGSPRHPRFEPERVLAR